MKNNINLFIFYLIFIPTFVSFRDKSFLCIMKNNVNIIINFTTSFLNYNYCYYILSINFINIQL